MIFVSLVCVLNVVFWRNIMVRFIWIGMLLFGLFNVLVLLMFGECSVDLYFCMFDSCSNMFICYECVNVEIGDEVFWKDIVKVFEYKKGSYVVFDLDDIKVVFVEGCEVVEVEVFVDVVLIGLEYFEKLYVLVLGKKVEKGYVLLCEIFKCIGKIGIVCVVICMCEYFFVVMLCGKVL